MKNILAISIIMLLSSCFSAKGLPIKEVKEDAPQAEQTQKVIKEETKKVVEETKIIEKPHTEEITTSATMVDHSPWDVLLKKYVAKNGDVDYKGFKNDFKALNDYVNYLSTQIPAQNWSVEEQLAYFINVYNANTIKLIVDNYPTKSIKDIKNPWLKNRIKIGDKDYSLADIENGILRKMNEPRIHFTINCASFSCPKLLNEAYTAENVEDLMKKATREFINNESKE